MAKSKIDIIYDMVNLAYDVKRQWSKDKDSIWLGDYARAVIKAKDEKVYDKFVDLANQLETEGWDEFIDACKYLIDEYNQFEESKKSMKESINGDCYIYFDDNGEIYGKKRRWVFCDNVKGITNTRDFFPLNDFIIDAIHIFKNEKQAQKFIDVDCKYFEDKNKLVIAEYPQTVSGFFESKESATKSIKESSVRCVTFEQIVDSRFDDISKGEKILNDRKNEIIELCGDDFSVYTNKIRFYDWDDGTNQYRQKYYVRKNNNKVTWNDLYKIVNSVKAVPYDFEKVNDTLFESRKSIKESADDNWYKLKMLNEMLDAMEEDEYNIPKLGIYGVTKNIDLDEGAIEALIKYYK